MKNIKKLSELKMNNSRQRIYADDLCEIVATGHDYDFIFYVENKTEKPIQIVYEDDKDNYIFESEDTYQIKGNDWMGFLADDISWSLLENTIKGKFKVYEMA